MGSIREEEATGSLKKEYPYWAGCKPNGSGHGIGSVGKKEDYRKSLEDRGDSKIIRREGKNSGRRQEGFREKSQ